jgi:site-specific recombinase XerD
MDSFVEYLDGSVSLISDISTNAVNSYINFMISRGLTNRTINNSLSVIKNLARYAEENYEVVNQVKW